MRRKLHIFLLLLLVAISGAYAQIPVAIISASPMSGCAPLAVSFNDASTNNPTSWSWTFPGGSPATSTSKNVAVLFSNPGTYTVTLVSSNASGSSAPSTFKIVVNPPPVANFTQDKTTGCFPTSVQFTNTSTPGTGATITSYAWDFGDGTQDTVVNPSHRYTSAGSFPVTLFVKNSFGCQGSAQIKNVQKAIVLTGGVVPNFSSMLASSCTLPVTASFTNSSTGPPNLTYLWNFGDGSPTSTLISPTHPYTVAGNYTVNLAVTSSQGCSDTLPLQVNITASGNLTDFTFPDTVCVNSSVTFTNISSPPPNSSTWNYGDGSPIVTAKNGQYTYSTPGTYPVTLNNTFSGCSGSVTKNIYVVNPPVASFTGTNIISCKPPLTSSFANTSTGSTSWTWDFGDGSTKSTSQTPLPHTYTTYGNFIVTLTASSASGCSSTQTLIVKVDKPTVVLTGFPAYGCAPYTFTPGASANSVDGIASYSWIFGNGNTSTSATPPAQTYNSGVFEVYLTVTTNGGCQATDSGTVKVGTIKPAAAFSFVPSSACVATPVSFTDKTPAGTDNQWFWQFGDGNTATVQNPIYSYPTPGMYNVTLTAYNNGCWDTISHSIVINPPLAKFVFASVCGMKNNFNFTDSSTGPVSSWTWNFGDGSPPYVGQTPPTHVFPAGPPKTYTVSLTVTNGTCTNMVSTPVNVNQTTTLVISNNSVCDNTPINFTAVASGNITNYEFVFGDGAVAIGGNPATSHTYTTPGIYQAKVVTIDNTGCLDSSAAYPVTINGPIVKFATPPALSCGPLKYTFQDQTVTAPANNIKTWLWNFGDGGTSTVQDPTYTYTFQGNFIPTLTVTDNNGCTSSYDSASPITVSIMSASFSTSDSQYCPTSSIKFNNLSTGGFSPAYSWNFGDGSPLDNTFSPVHIYPLVGKYYDTLTMTDTYGCVQKFGNITPITIDTPSATFNMSANYSACPPLNVQFTFTGHYAEKYAWILGNGAIAQIPNPSDIYSTPGDYYVTLTVQSPGGCSVTSDSQHIHIDGPIGSLNYTPVAGCDSLTVNFKVSTTNVSHFTWFFGDNSDSVSTTVDSIIYTYRTPGQYTPIVNLYDASGCKIPKIGAIYINVDSIETASFTANRNVLCDSGVVNFTNTSQLANGTAISNYDWNFGDGSADVAGAFPTTPHDYTTVGNDSVTMTITTTGGCTASAKLPIIIAASPQIAINGLVSQCQPAILNYAGVETVPDPNQPTVWTWNFGNGLPSAIGQTQGPIGYPKAGEYVVYVTATNSKGCSTMTDTTEPNHLFIYPVPSVNAGADTTICLGTPLQLDAVGDATTYNWQPPTNGAVLSCYACVNPVANPVPSSTYFVLNGSSPEGCQANDTIQVTVNTPVTVTANGSDSVCLGQNTQLNAIGATIYEWSPSEGLNNPDIANPVATPDASQVGTGPSNIITYTVVGYDSKKCFSDTAAVQVTAFNYPVIGLPANATINVGGSYQISSSVSTNVVSLNWAPSNTLSCSNCLTPLATPTKTTTYSLTAINDGGCAANDSIRVQVICNGANFFVPNTFSPNGDGVNDHFIVNGVGINVIPSITIYNRWGQIVFQKSNFAPNDASEAWDGTFNGQPAPSDVYIYTIQILCNNATLIAYHGNVTLIR